MRRIETREGVETISTDVVVLMDLEGTLTYAESQKVKSFGDTQNLEKVLNKEGRDEIGYWGVFQALTGEDWKDYLERFSAWNSGDISKEEFEEENIRLWNKMLDASPFDSGKELLERFNQEFLNLRKDAETLVSELSGQGFATGILSHAPDRFSEKAAKELNVDFLVPNVSFIVENGKFTWVEDNEITEDKAEILEYFEETEHEVVFIGNGKNDVSIAEEANKGYLVENEEAVDYQNTNAFTGTFEEVKKKVKSDLEAEN